MRTMKVSWAIVVAGALVFGLSGCILGVDTNKDGKSGDEDTGSEITDDADAGETGMMSDADTGMPPEMCTDASECTDGPAHTVASCSGGVCQYDTCEKGWIDEDEQSGNGCECEASSRTEYKKDNDGDGVADPSTNSEEFCSLPSDKMDLAPVSEGQDCNDMNDEVYPGKPDNENWLCDGLDNDCDDKTDEVCCTTMERPEDSQVANPASRQVDPVVVPVVTSDKPSEDAAFLVGWAYEKTLHFQHVDKTGMPVGPSQTDTVSDPIHDLAIAHHDDGYVVALSTRKFDQSGPNEKVIKSELMLHELDAEGTPQGSPKALQTSSGNLGADVFQGLAVETTDAVALLVYATDRPTNAPEVSSYLFDPDDPLDKGTAVPLPGQGSGLDAGDDAPKPVIAHDDKRFVVAWWAPGVPAELVLASIEPEGSGGTPSAKSSAGTTTAVDTVNTAKSEYVDLATLEEGRFLLAYPEIMGTSDAKIRTSIVSVSSTGPTLGAEKTFAGTALNRKPVIGVEPAAEEQSAPREIFVAWRQKTTSGKEYFLVAQSDASGGKSGDTFNIALDDPRSSGAVAVQPGSAGAVWSIPTMMGASVHFAPLSLQGVPICLK